MLIKWQVRSSKEFVTLSPKKFVSQIAAHSCASVCGHILTGQNVTKKNRTCQKQCSRYCAKISTFTRKSVGAAK